MCLPAYHQNIITDLLSQIVTYAEEFKEPYKAITAPFSLHITAQAVTLHPDIAIIRHPDKITAPQIDSIPLFVAEVTTSKTQYTEAVTKLKLYRELGIREYWIINGPDRMICAYEFRNKKRAVIKKYKLPCKMPVSAFPGLELYVAI